MLEISTHLSKSSLPSFANGYMQSTCKHYKRGRKDKGVRKKERERVQFGGKVEVNEML